MPSSQSDENSTQPEGMPLPRRRSVLASRRIYATIRASRRRSLWRSWRPWIVVSAIIHGAVFFALTGAMFGGAPVQARTKIEIDADIVELFRDTPVTYRSVIDMDEQSTAEKHTEELRKALATDQPAVPVMDVDKVDLTTMDLDLLDGHSSSPDSWQRSAGDLTDRVDTGGRDHRAVMNVVSRRILAETRSGSTLLCLLFDESRSLVRERALMSKQLERIFGDLKFTLPDKQKRNLKWALVSYSGRPSIHVRPTTNAAAVQKKLLHIPINKSGVENVLQAVEFCAKQFRKAAKRTLIVIVTDEQGDDVGLGLNAGDDVKAALRNAASACDKANARVYILGRESMMNWGSFWVSVETPEGRSSAPLERGLPTRRHEVCPRLRFAGIGGKAIPSGFGSYSLSTLANHTGGQFLIISSEPSPYNTAALHAYRPEWDYPDVYDKHTKRNSLRKVMTEVIGEMGQGMPSFGYMTAAERRYRDQRDIWRTRRDEAKSKVKWCDKALDRIAKHKGDLSKRVASYKGSKRWEANYYLLRAQIYKLKAALLEADAALDVLIARDRYPIEWPERAGQMIRYSFGAAPTHIKNVKFSRSRDAARARETATKALERVVVKYRNTPWAAYARHEISTLRPMRIVFKHGSAARAPSPERPHL